MGIEYVGYRYKTDHGYVVTKTPTTTESEPLMTVAQHERIVAGLEALLIDAGIALRDLGACPLPDCTEQNCLHILPRIDAFLAQTEEGVK